MSTGAITHAVADTGGELVKNWAKTWAFSTESLLKESKAGKYLAEYFRAKFEPDVAKRIATYRIAGDTPVDAFAKAHQEATQAHFGKRKEGLVAVLKQIYDEKGALHTNSVADGLDVVFHDTNGRWRQQKISQTKGAPSVAKALEIAPTSSYVAPKGMEVAVRKISPYTFTSNIVIPHMAQPINFLLNGGSFKNIMQALGELSFGDRELAKMKVVLSGAMEHEFLYNSFEAQTTGWKIFNRLFKSPGFNWVRQRQVEMAALTGKYAAKDAAYEFVQSGSKRAEMELKTLGLDPQRIHSQGGHLTDVDIDTAMYRFAHDTMFIRDELSTPFKWHQGTLSRLGTMYKDFSFREGKLVRDAIRRSAASGAGELLRTLGILTVLFPVAGEMIRTVEHVASGQNPTDFSDVPKVTGEPAIDNYIDAVGYSAGFGVAYSMVRAAKRRMMEGWIEGPFLSTAADLFNDLGSGNFQAVAKDFLRRMSWPGKIAANAEALKTDSQLAREHKKTEYAPKTKTKRHSGYAGTSNKWGL